MSIRKEYLQFALKGAFVSMLALSISHVLHLHQYYWVLFGAITVLKFNIGASFQRGKERLWGTFLGVLVSLLLANIFLHWTFGVYFLIPVCIFFAVYYLHDYFVSMFFMTLIFVLTIGVMSARPVDFAVARIGDTLIGVAMAGVVSLLIWPKSAGETLQTEVARFIDAVEARNLQEIERWFTAIEVTLELLQHEPVKKFWRSRERSLLRDTLDELRSIVCLLVYLGDSSAEAYVEAMGDYTKALECLSRLRTKGEALR